MSDDAPSSSRNDTPFKTRPLGRRASRWFLAAMFVLIVAGGIGMALFVVDAARGPSSSPSAADSTAAAPDPDTTNVQ